MYEAHRIVYGLQQPVFGAEPDFAVVIVYGDDRCCHVVVPYQFGRLARYARNAFAATVPKRAP